MKNREFLYKTCIHDILCRINHGIKKHPICVIKSLERENFSLRCKNYNSCEECLADWYNEETKIPMNEKRPT